MSATPTTALLNDPAWVDPTLNVTALVTGLPKLEMSMARDVAGIIAQSVLYGVYLIVFAAACFTILKKRRSRLATQIVGVSTVLMFLIATFLWSSALWAFFFRLQTSIGDRVPVQISQRVREGNISTAKVRYASDILFVFSFLIGDAVIGWRILVLWQWQRIAVIALTILYLGTFATGWGLIGCVIHADFPLTQSVPRLCVTFSNVSWLLSLIFNIAATGLLGVLALQMRRANRAVDTRRRTNVDRVLTFLFFTGVIYILLGTPRLSLFRNTTLMPYASDFTFATQTIEQILYQVVNLYPTAVTAILSYYTHLDETQKSLDDTLPAQGGVRTGTSLFNASRRTPASGTAVVMMGSGKRAMEDRSIDDVSLGPLGGKRSFGGGTDETRLAGQSVSMYEEGFDQSRRSSYGRPHAS